MASALRALDPTALAAAGSSARNCNACLQGRGDSLQIVVGLSQAESSLPGVRVQISWRLRPFWCMGLQASRLLVLVPIGYAVVA
jgi:hypothetical protein